MGVGFGFYYIKKEGNKLISAQHSDKQPQIYLSSGAYVPLFVEHIRDIEKFSGSKLDTRFYSEAGHPMEADFKNQPVHDPKEIKQTLVKILETIKRRPDNFPAFYWIGLKSRKTNFSGSETLYVGDEEVCFDGGWISTSSPAESLLRKIYSHIVLPVYNRVYNEKDGKGAYTKGAKDKLVIKRVSFYDFFKEDLETMIKICDYAIKNKYYLKSWCG